MLMENTACREDLCAEHGLSLYAEACGKRILFDAGQNGDFAKNAEKLGVNLQNVDLCVLSHGHYDHGGGMLRFLQENDAAKIFVHEGAFGSFWHGEKYIGLAKELRESGRLVYTKGEIELAPGLVLRDCADMPRLFPVSGQGLTQMVGGAHVQDEFAHEQFLSIFEGGKHVLLAGCAHKGVGNLMNALRPDVFVGGFHFAKMDPDGEELREYARFLAGFSTKYYTCHCTGMGQFARLQEILGAQVEYFSGGMQIES